MEKGYDAGKKVSGIKRHIAVDTQGLPHALAVTTADVTDRKGCLVALERGRDNLEVLPLAPYSPELNPIEKVWANIKRYLRTVLSDYARFDDALLSYFDFN